MGMTKRKERRIKRMIPEKTAELSQAQRMPSESVASVSSSKQIYWKPEMLLIAGLGFLFGGASFPTSCYPFGYALVAALPKYSAAAWLGVLLRMLLEGEELFWTAGGISLFYVCRICLNLFSGTRMFG